MANKVKELLEREIVRSIENLDNLSGKERTDAIDDIAQLHKLYDNEFKTEAEAVKATNEIFAKANERENAEKQLKEQKKDRWIRVVIAGCELVIPLVFYGIWMNKGFKFEQEGTFTSTTFRSLFNKFRPTRR